MFKTARILILLALPALLGGTTLRTSSAVSVGQAVLVHDASPEELDLVRWAVGRYERAGLQLPPLQVDLHRDNAGCDGETGFYHAGIVDLCPGLLINLWTQHTLLHEMAHAWSEVHVSGTDRERFLALRHLGTWNSWDVKWQYRGWEQAAEIISWGIGDRALSLWSIPDDSREQLAVAYRVLTGMPLPEA